MAGINGLTNSSYGKYAVGSKKTDTPKKTDAAKSSTAAGVQSSIFI